MHYIYNLFIALTWWILHLVAFFNKKIKLFVNGRKKVFVQLQSNIKEGDKVVWMHAASLGEFEQGLPILEQIQKQYPHYKTLLTFFSPSGYEIKRNSNVADIITYLPLDTKSNAVRFLSMVKPTIAIFIKYEIWPNYLNELENSNIPTFLVSALFKKQQIYFKSYGGFMRKTLKKLHHFFVQNDTSAALLSKVGITNVTVSGDSRFDRVCTILNADNHLDFMEAFKGDRTCVVIGSSWPEDEKVILPFLNSSQKNVAFVIAPHDIDLNHVDSLEASIQKPFIRYSKISNQKLSHFEVLIVDTIGLLTKIYSYADIAYVGGGFKTGLHNTLEPAVFGIPVVIGPNYKGFQEAEALVRLKGILVVNNKEEFSSVMKYLLSNIDLRNRTGKINTEHISKSIGATDKVMNHLSPYL